jgi:Bacterial Ig-like domain (group 3)/PKD domain/NHL repeat/Beta-propeller repeat
MKSPRSLFVDSARRFLQSSAARRRSRNSSARRRALERIEVCEDRTLLSATTTTAVSASAKIVPYGQTETLTATISSQAGVPNGGTVTFFDSATPLGTAPVNGGTATLSSITLSVGVHVIAATYSGHGANFAGSSTALSPASLIQTFAGTGVSGYNGDGILPTSAEASLVGGVAVDSHGNLFFADAGNSRVREVNAVTHLISTVAGTGTGGYNGDGIPATSAELSDPVSIAVDAAGDLFIADLYNNRVREVNAATGLISTVAGMSTPGYNGDGIPATSAELAGPTGVAVNAAGNVFIADSDNNRIREVNVATGLISTVAGTGTAGYNGDGIAATSAELNLPSGVAVDANGNLFIADTNNQRIREVNASTGLISTLAGTGTAGYSGDGTPATSAELNYPNVIAVDAAGDVFFSDSGNQVREVNSSTGLISTIAGTGTFGYNGDGIAATSAWLFDPQGIAVDAAGDVFIGDTVNDRVREVASGETTVEVTSPSLLTPTVTALDAGGTYQGSPFAATATAVGTDGVTPVSGSIGFTYYAGSSVSGTGSFAAPTDAGTYTVVADFESNDPDYADAESAPVTFTITPATPVVVASDAGGTFNGKPFPATATVTGPNNTPVVNPRTINYATFLGGSGDDAVLDTTTDRAGNTFVVGYTTSLDFPATPGAYETSFGAGGTQAGFVAKFDPSGVLLWATYIDGVSAYSVAVDSADNVYVGGFAIPGSFQATPGAFQALANAASQGSGFVAKLNSSGTSLLWGTYLGGSGFGQVDAITVDGSGDVYVAGDTYASDFPTLNAIQSTNPAPGFDVAFVSELNNTGSGLVFSTYLGGSGDSWPSAIALDGADNIYIDANVDAPGLPTTPDAFQSTYPGGSQDAFVAKLAAGGTSLAYLTYLGGSVNDTASNFEMAVDSAGDAYVTGTTSSPDFPTVNAYQSTLSGSEDAYVTELNPTGTALVDSTYFGGFSIATGSGIALDSAGNVYIAGTTQPTALTTLVNPVQTNGDYYLAEFDLSTATLLESTYLGTTQDNGFTAAVSVDASGNVIVTGQTDEPDFPTVNAFQPNYGGGNGDGFVMSISPGSPTFTYYAGTTASGTPLPGAPSAVGTYTVVATYTSTDPDYTDAQSDPVTFTISPSTPYPATPTVTAIEGSGTYDGQPFAATGLATGIGGEAVSGSFTFTYYVGSTVSGTGSTVAPTNVGTYTVVAAFTSSDPDYGDAESQPATFTISAATTSTTVSASAATEIYGQTETLTATVVSAAGGIPNAGSVTFTDGAITLGTAPVNNGIATLPTTAIPAGLNILTATYNGDGENFIGSSSVLSPSSVIETVAGNGTDGYTGDGGPGNQAELFNPSGIAVDAAGDLFIADNENYVVREVHAGTGLITTVAGTGTQGYNGDGIPATSAELFSPTAVAVDAQGDLFIADGERVREVSAATGLITTVAGTGQAGYNGDGIPATSAELFNPSSLAVDAAGDLFIADYINQRVREVNASTGLISTVAGTGTAGYNGDGIAATSAELSYAYGIALDSAGDLFIADSQNYRVREVSASTGLITTIAGSGTPGYSGDGSAATSAELNFPMSVAVDAAGNVFIADANNQVIREVATGTGMISTVAGTGAPGYNGDGIPAGQADLGYNVSGVAVDAAGDLFINDQGNDRVREVPSGATAVTVTLATPTVTVGDAGGVFNGSPYAATGTVAGVVAGVDNAPGSTLEGVPLTLTYYAGTTATGTPLSGAPSAAGTYTVVASFPGSQDYTSGSASATFLVYQALPVISVIDAGGVFNGSPFPATATIAGIVSGVDDTPGSSLEGVPLTLMYYAGLSPTGTPLPGAPSSAGEYTVEASFAGSTDYLSLGRFYSFVILQANPVFTVGDAGGTFNGSPFPGTGTVAGVVPGVDDTPGSSLEGVNLTLLYFAGDTISGTPLSGPPSTAGSYAIEAYFPGSQDYTSGGQAYFFVISQAAPVLTVSDPSGTYNGNPFAATATVAGIVAGVDDTPGSSLEGVDLTVAYYAGNNITGTPLSGPPTDAGTYTALATFPGSTDYRPTSDADVFSIAAATPTITVTDAGGPYTGQPYAASATATGVGGVSVGGTFAFTYYVGSTVNGTGSSTPPSNPGTYTVTAAFTSSNPDYSNASGGPVTFTISQTGPVVSAPSSAALYENGSLTFSTANGDAISVSDSAASGTSDSITLSVTHGTLKFTSTTGLKFTSGSNGSTSMTVNGTLANLNAALQTLKYTPTSGYIGADALSLTVTDSINHRSGSASVSLTVYGPPTLSAPATAGVNENGMLVFSSANGNAITLADAAASGTSDSLVLTATHGTLFLGSTAGLTFTAGTNGSASMTINGSLADLSAALNGLEYTPQTGYSGAASLTIKAKDATSGFTTTATVAITVSVPASQPTVAVTTEFPTVVPGQPVPLVIAVTDTNSTAQAAAFKLVIAFGDGKSATISAAPDSLIVNHVYTKTGTYTVSITATDEYGHVSSAGTTTISVVPVAVEVDPFDPSLTALFVGGTASKDTVTFTASGNQIAVTLNKVAEGTFSTNGPLIVFGQGGADVVTVGPGVTNTSYLLETPNADNAETDLDDETIQWAGLGSAVEILNE